MRLKNLKESFILKYIIEEIIFRYDDELFVMDIDYFYIPLFNNVFDDMDISTIIRTIIDIACDLYSRSNNTNKSSNDIYDVHLDKINNAINYTTICVTIFRILVRLKICSLL